MSLQKVPTVTERSDTVLDGGFVFAYSLIYKVMNKGSARKEHHHRRVAD